jgi:hypothetical protein
MRLPKQDFYGQEERLKMALAIAPVVLAELYKYSDDIAKIKELLPIEVAQLSKLIIEELKK